MGKGSSPRSCFSRQFKDNYSEINWNNKRNKIQKVYKVEIKQGNRDK